MPPPPSSHTGAENVAIGGLLYADANEVYRVELDARSSPQSRQFKDLRRVSLSPSGRYLTLCGEQMEVWEGDDSVWTLDASHTPRPLDVRLSPDGQAVLMLRDEHLVLHDLITGEEHVVGAAEGPSTGEMALSADGKLVAYCDEPVRELKVSEVASGKSIANPPERSGGGQERSVGRPRCRRCRPTVPFLSGLLGILSTSRRLPANPSTSSSTRTCNDSPSARRQKTSRELKHRPSWVCTTNIGWRWRELNPRPHEVTQVFSGRSRRCRSTRPPRSSSARRGQAQPWYCPS